jgi:hypothetical protein
MERVENRAVLGVQEVPGSNPGGPTKSLKELQTSIRPDIPSGVRLVAVWSPILVSSPRSFACPSPPSGWVMMAMSCVFCDFAQHEDILGFLYMRIIGDRYLVQPGRRYFLLRTDG